MTGEPTTSQVTETLVLYKHPQLYNGSRYKFYHNTRNYDDWLNSTSSGRRTLQINYQSISEPIRITYSLPVMDEYTYGSLTNNGKKYYIFIDTIETDQYGVSVFNFTVDWWATEWADLSCTIAHLTRKPTRPSYMTQPVSNLNMTVSSEALVSDFAIWATYIPSSENSTSFISYIIMDGTLENLARAQKGYWYQIYGIPGADIKDCFIVPNYNYSSYNMLFYVIDTSVSSSTDLQARIYASLNERYHAPYYPAVVGNYLYDTATGTYYRCSTDGSMIIFNKVDYPGTGTSPDKYYVSSTSRGYTNEFKMYNMYKDATTPYTYTSTLVETFTSTDTVRQGIVDYNGNLIWECPVGVTVVAFRLRYRFGISHIQIEFTPYGTTNAELLTGKGFVYDCLHVGLFVDSYQDYVLKNRDYDISMRQIQSDKELYKSVASAVENVGFGFAFGKEKGGAAAGLGGVVETIGTYVINSTFDPKIQEQYDFRYARMTDQISLVGDSISGAVDAVRYSTGILKKYVLSANGDAITRYNKDISTNGYYCDEMTDTLETTYFDVGNIIQADNTVVEGAVPLACKQQIVRRLQNGVEFI